MRIPIKSLLVLLLFLAGITHGYCQVIDFVDYKNYYKEELAGKDIIISRVDEKFAAIKDNTCTWTQQGDYYIIKPICFLDNDLPSLSFKESVDLVFASIDSFDTVYDTSAQEFDYTSAGPIFADPAMSISYQFQSDFKKKVIITQLESKGYLIKMHQKYVARNSIKNYSFFVVTKSLEGIGNCSTINYRNAMTQVDGLYLESGASFNLNSAISDISGYCKGRGDQNLSFFGGACGTAGQLFRVSLITPGITITKRANHSKWRVRYYGEYTFGDDAAVYEMDKQLEIQNTSGSPVYFKLVDKGNYTYLVGILPQKVYQFVHISKKETGDLTSQVTKTTIDKHTSEVVQQQLFDSTYGQKYYGGV